MWWIPAPELEYTTWDQKLLVWAEPRGLRSTLTLFVCRARGEDTYGIEIVLSLWR